MYERIIMKPARQKPATYYLLRTSWSWAAADDARCEVCGTWSSYMSYIISLFECNNVYRIHELYGGVRTNAVASTCARAGACAPPAPQTTRGSRQERDERHGASMYTIYPRFGGIPRGPRLSTAHGRRWHKPITTR